MVLLMGTLTVLSSFSTYRYSVESAMVAVNDPAVASLLKAVAMTTLWVVPIGVWIMALFWVPKLPAHVKLRSTSSIAFSARDNVMVKVT